mmetsp:Transcript_39046/g.107573  ORF Transcript_39046/g.107573 Transcript_39046/m.107573 type:complete len:271 (+) Transcript_39046:248-1060(+)
MCRRARPAARTHHVEARIQRRGCATLLVVQVGQRRRRARVICNPSLRRRRARTTPGIAKIPGARRTNARGVGGCDVLVPHLALPLSLRLQRQPPGFRQRLQGFGGLVRPGFPEHPFDDVEGSHDRLDVLFARIAGLRQCGLHLSRRVRNHALLRLDGQRRRWRVRGRYVCRLQRADAIRHGVTECRSHLLGISFEALQLVGDHLPLAKPRHLVRRGFDQYLTPEVRATCLRGEEGHSEGGFMHHGSPIGWALLTHGPPSLGLRVRGHGRY